MFQPIFMPLRAKVTIALVPVLLGILGHKAANKSKHCNKTAAQQSYSVFQSTNEKKLFGTFEGVAKNEN